MKFKKTESGRSMVEMLGVLAIIGVLSVGGIAGYTLSMRRHRANGVADAMSKYAMIIYGECQQQMINGWPTNYSDCGGVNSTTFENAGIGNLPAGVAYLDAPYFILDTTENGTDTVLFSVNFDDDKLCQAVGSITGNGCSNKRAVFKIKQN